MWKRGRVNEFYYIAKVYENGSEYGINGGRISKLEIRDGKFNTVYNYDRGEDMAPATTAAAEALEMILKYYA